MQSHFLAPLIDNSSDTVSFNKVSEEQLSILQEENKSHLVRPTWFLDSAHQSSNVVWPYFTQESWWDLKKRGYCFILKTNSLSLERELGKPLLMCNYEQIMRPLINSMNLSFAQWRNHLVIRRDDLRNVLLFSDPVLLSDYLQIL